MLGRCGVGPSPLIVGIDSGAQVRALPRVGRSNQDPPGDDGAHAPRHRLVLASEELSREVSWQRTEAFRGREEQTPRPIVIAEGEPVSVGSTGIPVKGSHGAKEKDCGPVALFSNLWLSRRSSEVRFGAIGFR